MNYFYVSVIWCYLLPICIDSHELDCKLVYSHRSLSRLKCCEGYELGIKNKCIPICRGGCPEPQVCIGSNSCGCLDKAFKDYYKRCYVCSPSYDKCAACDNNIMKHRRQKPICKHVVNDQPNADIHLPELNQNFSSSTGIQNNSDRHSTEQTTSKFQNDLTSTSVIMPNPTTTEKNTMISTLNVTHNCQIDCKSGVCINGICQKGETTTIKISTSNENIINSTTTILDATSDCQNDCKSGICTNGNCQQEETTTVKISTNGEKSICDRDCVNSFCVSRCECIQSDILKLNISSDLECLTTCDGSDGKMSCHNGSCLRVISKCQCFDGFFPKPGDQFECVQRSLTDDGNSQRKFLYIWIVASILLIVIVVGWIANKRLKRVHVYEIENQQSNVVFKSYKGSAECSI